MKKFLILAMMLLICSLAYSQENGNSISKGAIGVLFSFNGLNNLSLQNYDGGIGAKYFLDQNLAFRVGLRLNGTSRTTPIDLGTDQEGLDGAFSSMNFGLSGAVEYHLKNQRVSPFVGGGLRLLMSSAEETQPVKWNVNSTITTTRLKVETSGGLTYAVFGMAGLEIFLTKYMSLSAEYQLAYTHDSSDEIERKYEVVHGPSTTLPPSEKVKGPSSNTYGFDSSGVLVLAIYF